MLEASSTGSNPADFEPEDYRGKFIEAMDDDFNTPQALAVLFDMARELNRLRDEGCDISEGQETLRELGGVLGLTFKGIETSLGGAEPFIQLLVDTRNDLRKAKQYELADNIRKQLEALGVVIEDTPGGAVWKAKR